MYDSVVGKGAISLCMIVKNESHCIERCLQSVRNLVREMIVVDTGSTDDTKNRARACGAQVYDYPWHDDFAAARNESLKYATSEWILVLDADEVIAERDHAELRWVLNEHRYEGAWLYQRNYFEDPSAENWCVNKTDYEEGKGFTGYSDMPVLRLFLNKASIYYEGIVHELVDDSMAGRKVHFTDIPIHHYRKDFHGEKAQEKQRHYLELLTKAYEIDPENIKTCFLLGRQYFDLEQYPHAVAFFREAVRLGSQSEMLHANLALAFFHCQMFPEAVETLERVVSFNPRYAEAFATLGISYYQIGQIEKGINALVKAIALRPTSVTYIFNLAAIYYKEHDDEAAEMRLKDLVKMCPKFVRAYYLLFHVYERQKRVDEALELARIVQRMDSQLYKHIHLRVESLSNEQQSLCQ